LQGSGSIVFRFWNSWLTSNHARRQPLQTHMFTDAEEIRVAIYARGRYFRILQDVPHFMIRQHLCLHLWPWGCDNGKGFSLHRSAVYWIRKLSGRGMHFSRTRIFVRYHDANVLVLFAVFQCECPFIANAIQTRV